MCARFNESTDKESTGEDVGSTNHPFQAENSITSAKSAFFRAKKETHNKPANSRFIKLRFLGGGGVGVFVCVWC